MKAHKIVLLIVDHDNIRASGIRSVLENARYPNDSISPRVMEMEEVDIGDWDDSNPLNLFTKQKAEFDRLFQKKEMVEFSINASRRINAEDIKEICDKYGLVYDKDQQPKKEQIKLVPGNFASQEIDLICEGLILAQAATKDKNEEELARRLLISFANKNVAETKLESIHNATLIEFNSIIFDESLAPGDRLQRIASRIAQEGTEQQREMRRQESAEAANLQTVLMETFREFRRPYPEGLFGWARAALINKRSTDSADNFHADRITKAIEIGIEFASRMLSFAPRSMATTISKKIDLMRESLIFMQRSRIVRDARRYRAVRKQPYSMGIDNPTPEQFDARADFQRLIDSGKEPK